MKKQAIILMVDDSKADVLLTLNAFKKANFENKVITVDNGEEALAYLNGEDKYVDRENYPLPDLILLDLKMPGISGIEVLKKIKNTKNIKRIPVIILTSSKEEYDRALCYDSGANSYLVKPVSFNNFIDIVKSIENYWISLNVGPPL